MHGGVARRFIAIGGNGSHIGYASVTGCVPPEEAQSNAALIAAAPDLLEALKDVDLRVTQACIASTTVKSKDRSEFLRGELRRIQAEACAALAAAQGKE